MFKLVIRKKDDNKTECNLGNHFPPSQNILFNNNAVKLIVFVKNKASHTMSILLVFYAIL